MLKMMVVMLWSLLASVSSVQADSTPMDNFFTGLSTFTATFEQTITDTKGIVTQEASGVVTISRPGQFRWDYTAPYEQVVLGDGEHLWTYDADLEQATVKPQADALAGTPALLLSAEEQPSALFNIKLLPPRADEVWYELLPKSTDTQFSQLRLGFKGNVLAVMELVDAFEQTTQIRFSNLRRNDSINTDLFDFTPPAGVDVIGEMP